MSGRDSGSPAARLPGRAVPVDFYDRPTPTVAREALGLLLCRREPDGSFVWGRIVETEAYEGEDDPACHASAGLTPRTRVLYGPPGHAYVYFCYGMHHLLNFVTRPPGVPGAVLVRALCPERGMARMALRRGRSHSRDLASGPSRLCQALAVDLTQNETGLSGPEIFVRRDDVVVGPVVTGPRVGIRRGLDRPWRFWIAEDPHVSRGRPGTPRDRRRS